jgi:hypothetical protein
VQRELSLVGFDGLERRGRPGDHLCKQQRRDHERRDDGRDELRKRWNWRDDLGGIDGRRRADDARCCAGDRELA